MKSGSFETYKLFVAEKRLKAKIVKRNLIPFKTVNILYTDIIECCFIMQI